MEEGKEKMSTLKKTENNLGQDEKVRSLWKQSVIQFKHNRLAVVGLVIIVLFIVTILTTLAVEDVYKRQVRVWPWESVLYDFPLPARRIPNFLTGQPSSTTTVSPA